MVVQLFPTCLLNEFRPDAGMAVARVLEREGCEVVLPEGLTCCGQPAFNAGFHDEARQVARYTIGVLASTDGPIVVPSGSCCDMLVHQNAELFRDDPAMAATARDVAGRCREFSQFVAGRRGLGSKRAGPPTQIPASAAAPAKTRVAYHPSCHLLRGLRVRREPLDLIAGVENAEAVKFDEQEECCGFGGLFSIKNAEISASMMERKLTAIEASGAERLVSCDLGCLLHLEGGLRRRGATIRAQHLAELLDEGTTP
ncbi:MAG TPA: (Fe-S)-binding protein [Vicinamibacterales bacterium]|nr:(Fe-S)-binding protein [Vicinamibacterales bacterium]